ncbi:MAG: hypothetical protein ACK5MW_04235 [Enterococcus sp.]
MKENEMNELLLCYEKLIHQVLRKNQVLSSYSQYDDYLQELRLALYFLAKEFASISEFQAQFNKGYLFNKLSWKLRDLGRKEQRREERLDYPENFDQQLLLTNAHQQTELNVWVAEVFKELPAKRQQQIVRLLKDQEVPQLSQQMRYYWRKQLKQSIRSNFQELF